MQRAQQRLALVLAFGVVAALGVLVWRTEAPRTRPGDGDHEIWRVRRDQISAVERLGDASVAWRLERVGEGWWVETSSWRWPADPGRALRVADALDEAGRGVRVEADDPAVFGLDHPVALKVEVGEARHSLEVGRVAPVGGRTYVRTSEGVVVAVYGGLGEVAPFDALGLIDGAVVRDDALDQVRLRAPDGRSWSVWFQDGGWASDHEVDSEGLSNWVHAWRDLQVNDWLEQAPAGEVWQLSVVGAAGAVERGLVPTSDAVVVDFGDGRIGRVVGGGIEGLFEAAAGWVPKKP